MTKRKKLTEGQRMAAKRRAGKKSKLKNPNLKKETKSEQIANARLIAAAPELLEALLDAVAYIDRRRRGFDEGMTIGDIRNMVVSRADAAIAKAEGRA